MLTLNPAYISAQSQENSSKVAPSPNGSFEAKGSRFLGFLVLVREFESVLKTLKATHLKAVHFVYAYRELLPNGQILERSSDDGEPKGSSGISVLNVLRGWEMIDCGVIVVRYFGGTLLGIGGLVRAYTNATKNSLIAAQNDHLLITYEPQEMLTIHSSYANLRALHSKLKLLNIIIDKEEFLGDEVIVHIRGAKDKLEKISGLTFRG